MMSALGLKVGQFVGLMGDTPETEDDRDVALQQATRHLAGIIEAIGGHAA